MCTRALVLACLFAAAPASADDGHEHGFEKPAKTKPDSPVVSGPAKPNPKPGTPKPIHLVPKALPTDREKLIEQGFSEIPPFLAMFGPAELLEHTGMTSKPGDWLEYQVTSRVDGSVILSTLRVSHVAPAVEQGAWLEVDSHSDSAGDLTSRMLTVGRGNGNIRRILVRGGGLPLIELPLTSMAIDPEDLVALYREQSTVTLVGPSKVTVPLGTFDCDHWRVKLAARTLDFHIARDKSLPFNRAVKMDTVEGVAVASKRGTDAVAKLPAPRLSE